MTIATKRAWLNRQQETPEQKKAWMAEYHAQMARLQQGQDSGARSEVDVSRDLVRLGVPLSIVEVSAKPTETAALTEARRFMSASKRERPFLLLLGDTGVGKTVAGAVVLRDCCRCHPANSRATGQVEPAAFVEARRLTGLSAFSPEDRAWVDALKGAVLLVLDDVGQEGTPVGVAEMTGLLMDRANRRKATVITTNLKPEVFEARYGTPLWDRIKSWALIPVCDTKSMRRVATLGAKRQP